MPPVLPGLWVTGSLYRSKRWRAAPWDGPPIAHFSLWYFFYSSLTPSTLRTVRPSLPQPSVGGGRTRPGSRVAPVDYSSPCTFRRPSWLPYTYSRVRPSPVSLPQVAPESLVRTFLRGNTHNTTLRYKLFIQARACKRTYAGTVTRSLRALDDEVFFMRDVRTVCSQRSHRLASRRSSTWSKLLLARKHIPGVKLRYFRHAHSIPIVGVGTRVAY